MAQRTPATWIVVGASGFVGQAIVRELRRRGLPARAMAAPRLRSTATTAAAITQEAAAAPSLVVATLLDAFAGVEVIVNAAGLATPGDAASAELTGANALLPSVLARAARAAGVRRIIHLSSASVQGQRPVLDESRVRAPFSAYSRSKALGEEALEAFVAGRAGDPDAATTNIVTVRATSVQGPGRPTTASLQKIARSPLASVAAPGTAPTPVSSIDALAWFVAETGLFVGPVPPLVLQPWEGLSVREVLTAAGGRAPLRLPRVLCRAALTVGYAVSTRAGERLHGPLRRVELMWFGQAQTPGWAESVGLLPAPAVTHVLSGR